MTLKVAKELNEVTSEQYLSLAKYARRRLSRVYKGQKIPGGKEPEDFIEDLYQKVLEPDGAGRNWNPEKTPNFFDFLKSALKSEITNFIRKKANKVHSDVSSSDESYWQNRSGKIEHEEDTEKREEETEELIHDIYEELSKQDEQIADLFFLDIYGDIPDKEKAEELGITTQQVYTLRKKMKRHANKIYNELIKNRVQV
jgi:RNA polymerase sigma factor (sigma-70 family)